MGRYLFAPATFLAKTWLVWLVVFALSLSYHLVIERVQIVSVVVWWLAKTWPVWVIIFVLALFFRLTLARVSFG